MTAYIGHDNSVYSLARITILEEEDQIVLVSGDCNDKVHVWKGVRSELEPMDEEDKGEEEQWNKDKDGKIYEAKEMKQLEHHTDTVEFMEVNHDGKFLLTAGMGNYPRIWDIKNDFALK